MMTVKHLERQWNAKEYRKMFTELLTGRPERNFQFDARSSPVVRAAGLGLIRLEELGQAHVPLADRLLRSLLNAQENDGGWGDAATTALALRALLCGNGRGEAIERGIAYLANLQKAEGVWPAVPLRRMPADAAVSAFVLGQLADCPAFRAGVRLDAARDWFESRRDSIDPASLRSWERARVRVQAPLRRGWQTPAISMS